MRSRKRDGNGPRTVVITGGSSGLGRATALEFARRGWNVALVARGERSLREAAIDVERAGGRPLTIVADVADARAVDAAADRVAAEFGAIDVWVNNAAVGQFAPIEQTTAEEFRRITEVNYLGSIHGIKAALRHMRPRERGTIVQVGSVLSQRAAPLMGAYSGSKYAIRGLVDALRAELHHERSRVRVTIVEPPGMNTPFFEHARNKMLRRPRPLAPVYQPEVTARAIWHAIGSGQREVWVGSITPATATGHVLAPGFMDWALGHAAWSGQQSREPAPREQRDALFESVDDGGSVYGRFHDESFYEGAVVDPLRVRWGLGLAGAVATAGLTALALRALGSRRHGERVQRDAADGPRGYRGGDGRLHTSAGAGEAPGQAFAARDATLPVSP